MMRSAAWKSFAFLVLSVISILKQNAAFIVVNDNDKSDRTYDKQQRILLLSLDGFRTDYVHKYKMKHFLNFINDGTKARYLKPQFTTQTLPNHWSLITGTYQETHGIVSKHFYDPVYDDTFLHNKHNMKWWNSTEPLWHTASKHGLQTATVHWPGGDLINYKSNLYSYFEFNDSSSLKHKLSHIIKKFLHEHYVFIAVYDDQLDLVSHEYGIDSNEFNQTIRDLDAGLGHYIHELKQHGLYHANDFNTIILSTHGMCQVKKNIFFDQYISKYEAEILSFTSTIVHLVPIIQTKTLMDKLKRIPYIDAYLKADIPDRWHYKNNRRIGDILVVAKEGIALHMQNHVQASLLNSNLSVEEVDNFYSEVLYKAEHGYDNELESMRGMFIARGSAFKVGHASSNAIDNVDVYPLMCYLLDLECYPNNGSMVNVRTFLRSQSTMLIPSQSFKGTLFFCLYYFLYSIYF